MFSFDTSAYINGWRYHYPPSTFARVWPAIGNALADGRIISPYEVLKELKAMDDDLYAWAKQYRKAFVDPDQAVQQEAGRLQASFPNPGVRNVADPWVIAEAKVRRLTVVTYEGTSLNGAQTKQAAKRIPGVCSVENVPCVILSTALGQLGASL